MPVLPISPATLRANQYGPDAPTLQPFRGWRRGIWLLCLGLLLACQGGGTSPAIQESAAPPNAPAPSPTPTNDSAPGVVLTLSIDGESQPVQLATLVRLSAKGGFTMGFEESGKVKLAILASLEAPLAVGEYTILDTASAVSISGDLPAKLAKTKAEPGGQEGFTAPLAVAIPADAPLSRFIIYDWGKGLQELRGRRLGQLVFTRVADGTADGSFQTLAYRLVTKEPQTVTYRGQQRGLLKLEEHTVKGTFRNLPFADYEKSMGDLQEALKGLK